MIVLNAEQVREALPMAAAVTAMKRAFAAFSAGRCQMPLRIRLPVEAHEGIALVMPALVQDEGDEALAVKVVSVFPRNASQGLATTQAAVLLLEVSTGRPLALLEGGVLTAIRTGAASGAATDLLARADCHVLAVLGAGAQARTQLEGVCTVRSIEQAWVYDVQAQRAREMVDSLAGCGPIPQDLRVAVSAQEAIHDADVICTATTSLRPLFAAEDLRPGTHINAVGTYRPDMQEIPAEVVAHALVVVDSREAVLAESGDLLQPLQRGIIDASHIYAELGELVLGQKAGRRCDDQITLFKTVGIAVEDVVAAQLAWRNAQLQRLGQSVSW